MTWTKFALSALLAGSLALVGCGDDGSPPGDGGPGDGGGDAGSDDCTTGDTHFYVIHILNVGREDPTGVAPGFNLDGVVSDGSDAAGCFQADFTSPDGETGIDNQLAVLAPTLETALMADLEMTISESILDGSILILVEVTNVDDFTNDACVGLNLYIGQVPGGGMPVDADMDGIIDPGQTFDIDPASLTAGGDPMISVSGATINGGTLSAATPLIQVNIPFDPMMPPLPLNIRNANVEFSPSASALSNGIIGGQLDIDELVTAVMMLSSSIPPDLVRSTLEGVADLDADAMGVCQAVSVAVVFQGEGAVRGMVGM